MASLSLSSLPTSTPTKKPIFSKTSSQVKHSHRFKVSCQAGADKNDKSFVENFDTPKLILPPGISSVEMQNVDRRNMLLGLGGLYGAANLTAIPIAFGKPIAAPDNISECVTAGGVRSADGAIRSLACCPPILKKSGGIAQPYVLPTDPVIRVRPAAHRVDKDYIDKFKAAVAEMKKLKDDDPLSWTQQAKIHCAYCNGAYSQVKTGDPQYKIQVHNSFLFFPFHRWYLYFFERILGSLINDPTFAIPYWNWDNPAGMAIPAIYEDGGRNGNSLFDPLRNATHLPPAIFDHEYGGEDSGKPCIDQIGSNLSSMYRQMITSAPDTDRFFGTQFVAGMDPTLKENKSMGGSIENGVHTAAHRWVGNNRFPNGEDMGNFYSAGYDPLFYAHHGNVDRMWKIWKGLDKKRHKDPFTFDWEDASYVFYDENRDLVRVKNRDCVDIRRMGYDYQRSDLPWIRSRPVPHSKGANVAANSVGIVQNVEDVGVLPLKLDKTVKVLVKRPATNRTDEEKAKANEMLFLNGIQFDAEQYVKFVVFVNDKDDGVETTPAESEFAGSFSQLPHNDGMGKMIMRSGTAFGITEILEDTESEGDDSILVTIVPKRGCDDVTISGIKIQLVPYG